MRIVDQSCQAERNPLNVIHVDGKRVPDATLPFPFSGNVSRAPSAADIFWTFTAGQALLHNGAMSKPFFAAISLVFAAVGLGQEAKDLPTLITIYSSAKSTEFDASGLLKTDAKQIPGMAIIQQRRILELNEGETTISLPLIAATADFSTLAIRPASGDGFKVLSQTLVETAADPDALLRRAIGHEIIINRKTAPVADHPRTPETINAKLLAFDQNQLVVETGNRQLPVQIIPRNTDIAEIKLLAGSAAPTTQPAVSARISCDKAGPQEAILSYHASGITWHADYEILLSEDQSKARLTSSITILNRTGTSFDDARINLIASRRPDGAAQPIYSVPQMVSLAADAAQRVPFVDARDISCQMILACGPADHGFASTYLTIENSSKNNLARALPPGRLRVSKQSTLLADDVLPAIAPNDLLLVRLGQPSPITAKRETSERLDTDKSAANQTVQITLRNPTDQLQKILIIEPRPGAASQVIQKSSEFQMQTQSLLFNLEVPANGQQFLSYTIRRPAQ